MACFLCKQPCSSVPSGMPMPSPKKLSTKHQVENSFLRENENSLLEESEDSIGSNREDYTMGDCSSQRRSRSRSRPSAEESPRDRGDLRGGRGGNRGPGDSSRGGKNFGVQSSRGGRNFGAQSSRGGKVGEEARNSGGEDFGLVTPKKLKLPPKINEDARFPSSSPAI